MHLVGTMPYFHSRKPSIDEYEEAMLHNQLIDLNVNEADWDPMNPYFAQEEAKMLDFEGRVIERSSIDQDFFDVNMQDKTNYMSVHTDTCVRTFY